MTIHTSRDASLHWHGIEGSPLVVVLHDWHGRLPWADALAHRIADSGYRVAVPDLFGGRTSTDDGDADVLMRERLADTEGAFHVLSEVIGEARAIGSERVGLVGFSMGATLALEYARQGTVDAVVAYYGAARADDDAPPVRVPVLFQLAESDSWDGKESPETLRDRLRQEGADSVELRTYDGAVHGFQNEQIDARYSADASEAAFASTIDFIDAHVGTPSDAEPDTTA